jgi:hypothetical protein
MSNHGLLVSALIWNAVDRGFKSRSDQTKDYKISIIGKTDWLGIRIMCPSGATCLPTDCCFS